MNKYQEYLFKNNLSQEFIFSVCRPKTFLSNNVKGDYGKFEQESDSFTLTQDEDINIVDYELIIDEENILNVLEKVYILKNGQWSVVSKSAYDKRQVFKIDISFNDRLEKLKFSFKNGLADDYILNLKYIEADREKYYAKQARQKREDLLKKAEIEHSTGNDLVNIYFQPCCDEYARTEVILYKGSRMLATYKVEENIYYKAICALAYGSYRYIVKQYDKNDNLLLETDEIRFSIDEPKKFDVMPRNVNGNC